MLSKFFANIEFFTFFHFTELGCGMNNISCHMNAYCHNKNGTYECMCNHGYVGNGTHCGKFLDL